MCFNKTEKQIKKTCSLFSEAGNDLGASKTTRVDFNEDWCPDILGTSSPDAEYLKTLANSEKNFVLEMES